MTAATLLLSLPVTTNPKTGADDRAVDLFAVWLQERSLGGGDLDSFCARHPEQAADLRRLGELFALVDGAMAGPASEPLRGSIGPYRIERELGRGSQGTVYLARDERLSRQVALKVLPAHLTGVGPRRERFLREAELASRLDHRGICTVYETGTHDGNAFIAMRYVAGQTLAQCIEDTRARGLGVARLPGPACRSEAEAVRRVVTTIEQVARALHAAHESGLVHRDVKPSNLVLEPDGSPVILDFGLAQATDAPARMTLTGDLLGTPAYMSPEQVASSSRLDPRTDVYSLGATLYECLTLCRPFAAPTLAELFRQITDEVPVPVRKRNRHVTADLAAVVGTALEKRSDRRYKSALDFADDLARVVASRPVLARRPGPLRRAARWVGRNPLPTAVAVLGAAAAVLVPLFVRRDYDLARSLERERFPHRLRAAQDELDALVPDWPQHEAELAAWPRTRLPGLEAGARRVAEFAEQLAMQLDDPADAELHRAARAILGNWQRFRDDAAEGIASLPARLERARTVRARTIDAFAGQWAQVQAALHESERYGHLELAPQLDLVPLRRDPESGLYEFLHLSSGTPGKEWPQVDSDGRLRMTEDAGIVFVLLPPCPDVAPFFLAKHELTQGQWLRLSGRDNPSKYPAGRVFFHQRVTLAHPVENVSWEESVRLLRRHGLRLPSAREWEHACQAGTTTRWHTGDDAQSLRGYANVQDATWKKLEPERQCADFDDGWYLHAPVGALRANPFGLHDVHGNVGELCGDRGQRSDGTSQVHLRPGSFALRENKAASKSDGWMAPDERNHAIGLRAARRILP